MAETQENNYMVRLVPIASISVGDPAQVRQSTVAFKVTPAFSENRTAEYTPVTPIHMPGAMQVYKHTNSRTFSVTAHLISRNINDAIQNMADLQKLRAWLLPYFGATDTLSSAQTANRKSATYSQTNQNTEPQSQAERDALVRQRIQTEGVQLRGAPPDVLYLYAYSANANDIRGVGPRVNINRVPVVMTSLDIVYPEDVDYIPVYTQGSGPTGRTEPFPRKMDVTLTLIETHSPREYEKFDLLAYKLGNLPNF